jgi:hypothetical protein
MSITLTLSPEAEKALQHRATERGVSLAALLSEVVEREIGLMPAVAESWSDRARAFLEWAESFPETPLLSDVGLSRESLYPDRW